MKGDYFYVVEYPAVLHDDTPTILFVACVRSKWPNGISDFSKKKCKTVVIYDMLFGKDFVY